MNKLSTIISSLIIILALFGYGHFSDDGFQSTNFSLNQASGNLAVFEAYENKSSDVQLQGQGKIVKLLPDDLKGSKHQKFIIEIDNGLTVLISHNIDLAPRINELRLGGIIEFFGEYEWNSKGGVVHWTHHDPKGRHADGWLKYQGKIYQ